MDPARDPVRVTAVAAGPIQEYGISHRRTQMNTDGESAEDLSVPHSTMYDAAQANPYHEGVLSISYLCSSVFICG